MRWLRSIALPCAVVFLSIGAHAAGQKPEAATPLPAGAEEASVDAEIWAGGRYRLTPGDVIEVVFPYVPEFDQEMTIQPDGYVTLRAIGELRAQGRTLPEFRQMLYEAYEPILRDPVVTISLKDFEKPYFIAAGEVKQPGKFDLRGPITVTQALALAGGLTGSAKHSQVLLVRRFSSDLLEVKEIDVKKMEARRDWNEDALLRPGDTVFVPKSFMSRIRPYIPVPGFGFYLNPF